MTDLKIFKLTKIRKLFFKISNGNVQVVQIFKINLFICLFNYLLEFSTLKSYETKNISELSNSSADAWF